LEAAVPFRATYGNLFPHAFFFQGFTGLAINMGAILTLFVVIQVLARLPRAGKT
jgi:hypothetical protein